jgi:hypothetical protein
VIWQARRQLQFHVAYRYLLPGDFLEETIPGARRHLAYMMWTLRL